MSHEQINRMTQHLMQTGRMTVVEGMPEYLFPHPDFPTQDWNLRPFREGELVTSQIMSQLPQTRNVRYALVDDVNFVPFDNRDKALRERYELLKQYVDQGTIPPMHALFFESQFIEPGGLCSVADAHFQLLKIRDFVEITKQGLRQSPHLVVVHPTDFQNQQQSMLYELMKLMKTIPPFNNLSKANRLQLLTNYIHVWIDSVGNIQNITKPLWLGDRFIFDPINF